MPRTAAPMPSGMRRTCAASASRPARATTPGHPIVVGHDRSPLGPCALFYGHYDVQPVDPLELWEHDPFEPFVETRRDGTKRDPRPRRLGRQGPADDLRRGLPGLEGGDRASCRSRSRSCSRARRKSGGVNLPAFLEANAGELRADIGLICDTNMWDARDAGDPDHAARPVRRGDRDHRRRPRPAFRLLRLGGGQPQPRARPHPGRSARRRRPRHVPGFYDGVPELPAGAARAVGHARLRRRRLSSAPSASRSRPARKAAACSR